MGNIYLITGASSDLAAAYIRWLDEKKEECIVLGQYYSHKEQMDILIAKSRFIKIIPYSVNLSNLEETDRWMEMILDDGYIPDHILHTAAEPFSYVRIPDFDWNELDRQLRIQVNTFGQMCKKILPKMGKNRFGKVVVILSAYVFDVPPKYMVNYIVTKYALLGMMKSAATEYAEKNVNINAVSPGLMETKFLRNLESVQMEIAAKGMPLKRNIKVSEVVKSIEYLMSDASDYMTGVNINLTGGSKM